MNNIYFTTNLITNFKPSSENNFISYNLLKKKNETIYCRNFFLYLLLLKYKNKNFFKKSTIFVKPFIRKIYTTIRSPYRHKLARHQFSINRYNILSSVIIPIYKNLNLKNFNNIMLIFKNLKKFDNIFESNLIFIHKFSFSYQFIFSKNFDLDLFKANNKQIINQC